MQNTAIGNASSYLFSLHISNSNTDGPIIALTHKIAIVTTRFLIAHNRLSHHKQRFHNMQQQRNFVAAAHTGYTPLTLLKTAFRIKYSCSGSFHFVFFRDIAEEYPLALCSLFFHLRLFHAPLKTNRQNHSSLGSVNFEPAERKCQK